MNEDDITLRDIFALLAMHALMVDGPRARGLADALTTSVLSTRDAIAQTAYAQADAMLKARSP